MSITSIAQSVSSFVSSKWHYGVAAGIAAIAVVYFAISHLFSLLVLGAAGAYGYVHAAQLKAKLAAFEAEAKAVASEPAVVAVEAEVKKAL